MPKLYQEKTSFQPTRGPQGLLLVENHFRSEKAAYIPYAQLTSQTLCYCKRSPLANQALSMQRGALALMNRFLGHQPQRDQEGTHLRGHFGIVADLYAINPEDQFIGAFRVGNLAVVSHPWLRGNFQLVEVAEILWSISLAV